MMTDEQDMNRKCRHCGFTWGSHHGGTGPWPKDYCPGHEGRTDWENGPGTVFEAESANKWLVVDRNKRLMSPILESLDLAWTVADIFSRSGHPATVVSECEYNRLKAKEE